MKMMNTTHIATDENHVSRRGGEYPTHRRWWSLLAYATFAALTLLVMLILSTGAGAHFER